MNEVCADLERETARLELPFRPYTAQNEPFFAAFNDSVAQAKDRLEELNPPPADDGAVDRLVDGYESVRGTLDEVQVAASTDQDQEITPLFDELDQQAEPVAAAEKELGVCPGKTSVRRAVVAGVQRTTENPIGEEGELGG